jgi:hypothetical protein
VNRLDQETEKETRAHKGCRAIQEEEDEEEDEEEEEDRGVWSAIFPGRDTYGITGQETMWTRIRSGRFEEEKHFFFLPEIESRFFRRPAHSLVTILTELSRVPFR